MMNHTTLDICRGVLHGHRSCLSRAITLVESSRSDHRVQALYAMSYLNSHKRIKPFASDFTLRIGISGPPGAGKSTFIDAFGTRLVQQYGHRVAVIAVDPSSHISGGSILGDKTRMEALSRLEDAYIRSSPTRGVLGGVAEQTSNVVSLCESARYDVVLIESVGIGQSEVEIDSVSDMVLYILPPGAGDELQASKKGVMEVADLILVNKADAGALQEAARKTAAEYAGYMQFVRRRLPEWAPPVKLISALTGLGLDEVYKSIKAYHDLACREGYLQRKRAKQYIFSAWSQTRRIVQAELEDSEQVQQKLTEISTALSTGEMAPAAASRLLANTFLKKPLT